MVYGVNVGRLRYQLGAHFWHETGCREMQEGVALSVGHVCRTKVYLPEETGVDGVVDLEAQGVDRLAVCDIHYWNSRPRHSKI